MAGKLAIVAVLGIVLAWLVPENTSPPPNAFWYHPCLDTESASILAPIVAN